MKKNTFDSYLADIKAKYELEKTGEYSSYLSKPTPGSIKNLCSLLKNSEISSIDKEILNKFYAIDNFDIDKFRPICKFFTGKTEIPQQSIVDIMAFLVNLEPRPLGKYLKSVVKIDDSKIIKNVESNNLEIKPEESKSLVKIDDFKIKTSFINKNKTKIVGSISLAIISTFLISKTVISDKQCMEWQKNHYEVVECENKSVGFATINSKVPLNENLLDLRKIEVSDTTTFFKHNKAIIWYYKNDDKLEFFNAPGFHPENDKPLKPITQYMIDKYVK